MLKLSDGLAEAVDAGGGGRTVHAPASARWDSAEAACRGSEQHKRQRESKPAVIKAPMLSFLAHTPTGTDLQGDERERALRAAAVVVGARICEAASAAVAAAAPTDGPKVEPWQLSMFLLQREEQAQRQRQGEGHGGAAAAAAADEGPLRHVAKGTVAY